MLRQEEWLPQARRLAVGMQSVTRHGHERRPNLKIGNARDRYWAWCHACKDGAVLSKEHVLLGGNVPEPSVSLSVPSDLRPVLRSDYEAVVARFLASKGMDMQMLPKLWYSEHAKRLCLQDDTGGWHGRDLTDKSNAKWLHYRSPKIVGTIRTNMIVTEDLFSMYKVAYAVRDWPDDIGVATTLGAGCSLGAALALKNCRRIVWAYDGDAAGDAGYISASKRMRVHGPKQMRARPPDGLDPKDMHCADIRLMIKEAFNHEFEVHSVIYGSGDSAGLLPTGHGHDRYSRSI